MQSRFTPEMIDAIYAAWHGAGVDILGGNWNRFVELLSTDGLAPFSKQGYNPRNSTEEVVHIIVRHNQITGHRYVLTDGRNDRIFKTREAAEIEARRLLGWGSAHEVEIHSCFTNPIQAREYCYLTGQGMSKEDAIRTALEMKL